MKLTPFEKEIKKCDKREEKEYRKVMKLAEKRDAKGLGKWLKGWRLGKIRF